MQHDGVELADLGRDLLVAPRRRACRFRLSICELSWPRMSLRRARLPSAALRRSSASWRRLCRPAMPAASSRMRRRCSGLALTSSPIWPWRTSAGERAPVAASSNRMRTSRARTSRPLMRKAEPASRSMRRVTSSVSLALNSAGAWRAELSMKIVTSAVLRAGRDRGAGEDHVVHGGRAHALVRGLAHHPAQRFEQVRLAAAVGADDAGQALSRSRARSAPRRT